jgi:hypothetical protein
MDTVSIIVAIAHCYVDWKIVLGVPKWHVVSNCIDNRKKKCMDG